MSRQDRVGGGYLNGLLPFSKYVPGGMSVDPGSVRVSFLHICVLSLCCLPLHSKVYLTIYRVAI